MAGEVCAWPLGLLDSGAKIILSDGESWGGLDEALLSDPQGKSGCWTGSRINPPIRDPDWLPSQGY